MLQLIVFLALAFSIIIAIFAVQNTTPVAVSFLMFRAETVAVSVLVLISAALGAGAMLLLGIAREVRLQLRHRSVAQRLKAAEARVEELQAQQTGAAAKTEELPAAASAEAPPGEGSHPRG